MTQNKETITPKLSLRGKYYYGLGRRKTAVAAMLLAETALARPERLDSCGNWQYS